MEMMAAALGLPFLAIIAFFAVSGRRRRRTVPGTRRSKLTRTLEESFIP